LPSLDNLDHPGRLVSADVVSDYNVRSLEFVVCQMHLPLLAATRPALRVCADVMISKSIAVWRRPAYHPGAYHDSRGRWQK
jgi:hypothetical protein